MIDMIESWLDNGYNVFLFDQRNSGTSGGDICTYGYLEWQDVLGAIAIVKQISVTTDVILFGIGTGCTSSLLAYSSLPPEANVTEVRRSMKESKAPSLSEYAFSEIVRSTFPVSFSGT